MFYILIVGGRTYVVKALTKSSKLRDEKPLNIENVILCVILCYLILCHLVC